MRRRATTAPLPRRCCAAAAPLLRRCCAAAAPLLLRRCCAAAAPLLLPYAMLAPCCEPSALCRAREPALHCSPSRMYASARYRTCLCGAARVVTAKPALHCTRPATHVSARHGRRLRHERSTARARQAPASPAASVPVVSDLAGPEGPPHHRAPSSLAAVPPSVWGLASRWVQHWTDELAVVHARYLARHLPSRGRVQGSSEPLVPPGIHR
jgi:hypothetical protein